ncbi:GNAT family N-acetyltransferase [Flavobacterium branchiicola]|uniref:GNAT family N-acetyltransferase n=1 Tax=Flavobacterium branchiicola TaxID=1114875 RepID=A0ABV9PGV0_9FLAO|nr:GNAT family N-acetyltransferase [Flavobacterium branchiicola]MBS7254725.1 GNAT family N-acetyltransferase [Flavobacterium branchiicola]
MNQNYLNKNPKSNSEIEIREIRKDDCDRLRVLFLKERQNTFTWLDISAFSLEDFDKHTQGEFILVALLDAIPVGFISIWMPTNFIHNLYIDQDYQDKGIGTKLLEETIHKIGYPLSLKCLEKNTKAVAFYERKGFAAKEKGNSENGTYILFSKLKPSK